ncbi:hypothetical protein SAMN04488063_0165 [Halopelagius inordinatus]|uniref:DUF7344 domain-containing protein n=1 Tax=Halopelagius inordinatus TaxID=553467 RepID=A0A1I2LBQ6_9EURY|nr:hypothetical protein [Halopelagius inordinatus]SFF75899.1 hypothetical protein SAMN04488063_0165 [Halopelagius inordinatus]
MSKDQEEWISRPDDLQNAVYKALTHPHRRTVLRCVAARQSPVSVDRLASEVAAAEDGVTVAEVTDERRTAALVALVHLHLPELDRAGFVRWDREPGHVASTSLLAEIAATPVSGSVFDPFPAPSAGTG